MACEGCYSEIKRKNAEQDNLRQLAQRASNETREWVGIFEGSIYVGKDTVGRFIREWFTPQPIVQDVH